MMTKQFPIDNCQFYTCYIYMDIVFGIFPRPDELTVRVSFGRNYLCKSP